MKQAENTEGCSRWRCDGAPAGDVSVVAGSGSEQSTGRSRVAGDELSGQDALAVRASKKLRSDEHLLTSFAATRLRMELDRVPLWRGNHVAIKQLAEDFARYLYLPRLKDSSVLVGAIRDGVGTFDMGERKLLLSPTAMTIAMAVTEVYAMAQQVPHLDSDSPGLLVKPDIARVQLDAEIVTPTVGGSHAAPIVGREGSAPAGQVDSSTRMPNPAVAMQPKRFHGTVTLDATRVGRDASRIADEVIAHLAGLVGAAVTVTLEVDAVIPSGAPDHVVRTVTENSRTLKFTSQGFEKE